VHTSQKAAQTCIEAASGVKRLALAEKRKLQRTQGEHLVKDKAMLEAYLSGMTYDSIGAKFEISGCRVAQRIARYKRITGVK